MISLRATGAYVDGIANLTPPIPPAALEGDMMLCFYGAKPFNDLPTMNNGWIDLGWVIDGVIAPGSNTGSMQVRAFYKIHSGAEVDPTITTATNNVSGAVITVFQRILGSQWAVPVGVGGGDNSAGGSFTPVINSAIPIAAGDMLVAYAAIRSNAGTQSAITVSAAGLTMGVFTESPAADLTTALGGDMAMSGGHALVTAGNAIGVPAYSSLLANPHTGSAFIVRLRLNPAPIPVPPAIIIGDMYILFTITATQYIFQIKSSNGVDIGPPFVYDIAHYKLLGIRENATHISVYPMSGEFGTFPFTAQFPRDRIVAIHP